MDGHSLALVRATGAGVKPATFGVTYGEESTPTALFHSVKDLIVEAGHSLIACPGCDTPFLAVGKQLFCTTTCAQRSRNEKRLKTRSTRKHGKPTRTR